LAFDGSGNFYVANYFNNTVTVYAPGKTSPLRTISNGIDGPDALAIGRLGYLYVANGAKNTVTEYAPGGTHLVRTISQGVSNPRGLAFGP
jgi:DNA-binding beta-propeller fold protein YncE